MNKLIHASIYGLFFVLSNSLFANNLDLKTFEAKLEEANNLSGISANSPEATLLKTLNEISENISGRKISGDELDKLISLVESTDLIEEAFPKQAIISFEADFLAGSSLNISDLTNASFFLNSLNKKKIEKMENIEMLLGEGASQISKIQESVVQYSGANVKQIISQLESAPDIDLVALSSFFSDLNEDISSGVQQAETALGSAISDASSDLADVSNQINSATTTLSFAAGAAMSAAAYSLDEAATAISNTISAGVSVDLEAASQGMGYDDFAAAVDAYNQQYGTNYTVEGAKEALGQ